VARPSTHIRNTHQSVADIRTIQHVMNALAELKAEQRQRQTRLGAQISCLFLGLGLLVWGIWPLVVLRLITGKPPGSELVAVTSFTMLIGFSFVGLSVLIRGGIDWALWTALTMSLGLLLTIIAAAIGHDGGTHYAFTMLLSTAVALTSWLALMSRPRPEPAEPASSDSVDEA
jgi:uncharacterized membrane protein